MESGNGFSLQCQAQKPGVDKDKFRYLKGVIVPPRKGKRRTINGRHSVEWASNWRELPRFSSACRRPSEATQRAAEPAATQEAAAYATVTRGPHHLAQCRPRAHPLAASCAPLPPKDRAALCATPC